MDSLGCFSDAASVSRAPAMARISVADHAGKPEDPTPQTGSANIARCGS